MGKSTRRKTWNECVEEDMKRLELKRVHAQNRAGWRSEILGNLWPEPAPVLSRTDVTNGDDDDESIAKN